jgi:hypothetical protein
MAVVDGIRDAANRWVFRDLALDPWHGVRMVCFAATPAPTHAVEVAEHLDAAVASLRAHERYLSGLGGEFDPDRFLREQTTVSFEVVIL